MAKAKLRGRRFYRRTRRKDDIFSFDGGHTLSTLSFNNEFNSNGTKVNGGDTADFNQLDVFGTGNPGETNKLSLTDIQTMDALGWNPTASATLLASQITRVLD